MLSSRSLVGRHAQLTPIHAHGVLQRRPAAGSDGRLINRPHFPILKERNTRRGFLDRILLSHDVCAQSHLVAFGGSGYDYLPARFGDRLREADLGEDELRMLFIENPRRALAPEA